MKVIRSKLTAQGQISVPAAIRRKLGLYPGSVMEWAEDNGKILVRRAGKYSSKEIHDAVFKGQSLQPRTLDELKEGIHTYISNRYAVD